VTPIKKKKTPPTLRNKKVPVLARAQYVIAVLANEKEEAFTIKAVDRMKRNFFSHNMASQRMMALRAQLDLDLKAQGLRQIRSVFLRKKECGLMDR